jgi:hypothetical protein
VCFESVALSNGVLCGVAWRVWVQLNCPLSSSLSLTLSLHNFTNRPYTHFQEFTYLPRYYICEACWARFLRINLNASQMISVVALCFLIDIEPLVKCYSFCNFANHIFIERSWYSDWLRARRPRGWSSSPGRVKIFLFSTSSKLALGPTQPPSR